MTLNVVMALILHYFTEFVYDVVVKQLSRFQNLLLIVYDHINTICTIIQLLCKGVLLIEIRCNKMMNFLIPSAGN